MTVVLLLDKRLIWNNSSNNSNYLYRVTTSIIVGPLKTVAVSLVWRRGDFFLWKEGAVFFLGGGESSVFQGRRKPWWISAFLGDAFKSAMNII